MDSIPKFFATVLTVVLGVLICVSFIISTILLTSARSYHASVIDQLEASNYDEVVISECKQAAEKANYKLDISKEPSTSSDSYEYYKVTLTYGIAAPIFGKIHVGDIVGYALPNYRELLPTENWPKDPVTGDVFYYGDYEYHYNEYCHAGGWTEKTSLNGWAARVLDDSKESYSDPLSYIGDEPVVSLGFTYYDCANLKKAPKIPETITHMSGTYWGCTVMSSDVVIPEGVTTLSSAFKECEAFVTPPHIPDGVTDMTHAFDSCINLEIPSNIPSSVTTMGGTFQCCYAMVQMPVFPADSQVETMGNCFYKCYSLPSDLSGFVLPPEVYSVSGLFYQCTSIVTAPVVPATVSNMSEMFDECTSLTGTVIVNCELSSDSRYWEYAFRGTTLPITIIGDADNDTKENLTTTSEAGNVIWE